MELKPLLAVIPARGGSKGLPGKNTRPLAGLPLIAHSILLAKMCPVIDKLIVSTDSEEIASVARDYGALVPFMRPSELAQDDTPAWAVIRHSLIEMEKQDQREYGGLLLLDATSPGRIPSDVSNAHAKLAANRDADGIIGVSEPDFNPMWNCVVESDGVMKPLVDAGQKYHRRQDVPKVYRINSTLYIWRRNFILNEKDSWRRGKLLLHEIPESRAMHIDDQHGFDVAELFIKNGLIELPWLINKK